jgi:hypothetical protein
VAALGVVGLMAVLHRVKERADTGSGSEAAVEEVAPVRGTTRQTTSAQDKSPSSDEIGPDKAAAAKAAKSVKVTDKQLQKKFKHAGDFGVSGNYHDNGAKCGSAINEHVNSPDVKVIQGTYCDDPATLYVNPNTGLTVITDPKGNFVSGWKLSPQQLNHVLTNGKLGGDLNDGTTTNGPSRVPGSVR